MHDSPLRLRPLDQPRSPFGFRLRGTDELFAPSFLRTPFTHDFSRIAPSLLGSPPAAATAAPAAAAHESEPDAPQMNMPWLGLTNSAWMAQNPLYTLTTEFMSPFPLMSQTTPGAGVSLRPSLLVNVRDRIGPNSEFGVFGGFGGAFPLRSGPPTGTGLFGFSLHLGPQAPEGDRVAFGTGAWLSLYQGWGSEPTVPSPPQGWTFNPNFNAMIAHSWQRPDHWGADLVWGANVARWGAVNDVAVGGFLNPYIGFNYSRNLTKHDTLNWEVTLGANLGINRYGGQPGPQIPASGVVNLGLFGYQHTWGDYGFGIEPWFVAEPFSNIANSGASPFNVGGGLRFDFGAINPRRAHVDDPWPP
jgi:hypothetical protein